MSEITLRDYQKEAVQKVVAARDRGVRRQLGVAATGAGKTILFSALTKLFDEQTLILAHRDELIEQAVDKLKAVWPEVDVGVVKAARNEFDHQVVVASIQTLARKQRREKIPADRFKFIICDEAHHICSPSYVNVLGYFGADGSPESPLLLGVTATPDRSDGHGLDKMLDEIVFNYDILWLIRSGYLCDLRGIRIHLKDLNLDNVKISKGDYDAGQAGQAMEDANAPALIAQAWLEKGEDRKSLVFTPTVATAAHTAEEFRKIGVTAEYVSGETPLEERRLILKRFANGEIKVLANCSVLLEGYDDPTIQCIIMARPTKSRALYTQCIGRGSRKHPDKRDCLVMDICGASDDLSLITIPSLFGIKNPAKFQEDKQTVAATLLEQEEEEVRQGKLEAKAIDLFKKILNSPVNWVAFTDAHSRKAYSCGLGKPESGVALIEHLGGDDDQQWHVFIKWDAEHAPEDQTGIHKYPNGDCYRTLISGVDLEMAQGVGEDYVRKNGITILTDRTAKWRQNSPTKNQLDAARKWRMAVDPSWTAGQLSDALSAHIESKKNRSRGKARADRPKWLQDKIDKERKAREPEPIIIRPKQDRTREPW